MADWRVYQDYAERCVKIGLKAQAIRFLLTALTLAPNELAASRCLDSLGQLLMELGQFNRSSFALNKSLALKTRVLGPQHPEVENYRERVQIFSSIID